MLLGTSAPIASLQTGKGNGILGREYMGIERATFLIDPKGVIREIWHKVKVKGHAEAVLESLKNL